MKSLLTITITLLLLPLLAAAATTISFTTLGRSSYAFDIFALPTAAAPIQEIRLTDGNSVNFNGHFPSLPTQPGPPTHLIYVSERNGASKIYLDVLPTESTHHLKLPTESTRSQHILIGDEQTNGRISMKDRPTLVNGTSLIYISTHEDPGKPRSSWTAVYSTELPTGSTRRLTPPGIADYSPAVSPSGALTAVASYGEKGWSGDVEELATDIYVFATGDGSGRVKIVEHGGWPSWGGESTLYFHRRCEDGWWSVFAATFDIVGGTIDTDSVVTRRVTPPGLHAFTPAASPANESFIAVATRRAGSDYRHIELYDVVSNKFHDLTRPVAPYTHHFNPFVSPGSEWVGYHKCRGETSDGVGNGNDLVLENVRSPLSDVSLFRVDGSFPSYSPDGERVAYVRFPGVYVMNSDGSGIREVSKLYAFTTAWDWKRNVVYTSAGPDFSSVSTKVDIVSINVDDEDLSHKTLTKGGANNAFPSPSPDGKWVVFRSGRSGHKNLYIMDAINGEEAKLYRLTEGPWSDTMCNWSPDGEWIAFASDRENPGAGGFEIFKIHPNGTGLQKVIQSGSGGRTNHPWFSPDGKQIVFTTDYAGVSAEPISNPHHYQPYGEIFVINSDGSGGLQRLTHNSYEDGTPTWSPKHISPTTNVEWPYSGSKCLFEDLHWLNIDPNQASKRQCAAAV